MLQTYAWITKKSINHNLMRISVSFKQSFSDLCIFPHAAVIFPLINHALVALSHHFFTSPGVFPGRDVSVYVYVCVRVCARVLLAFDCLLLLLPRWCEGILVILHTSPIPFPVVTPAAPAWVKHSPKEGWGCWGQDRLWDKSPNILWRAALCHPPPPVTVVTP